MPPEDNSDPNLSNPTPSMTNPDNVVPVVVTPSQPVEPPSPQPVSESPSTAPAVTPPVQPDISAPAAPNPQVADVAVPQPDPSPVTPTPTAGPVDPVVEPKVEQVAPPIAMSTDNLFKKDQPSPGQNQPPVPDLHKKKKKLNLKPVLIILAIFLFAGSVSAAYFMGMSSAKEEEVPEVTAKPITLPPEAIVTAECVPGRGKQYIIPKDIPVGPIYDVNNGRVIAIEYNLPIVELLSNPDTFSDTLNQLMKNYSTDHFTLVPSPPKPGEQVSEVHLIMFVVPKEEADSITCGLTPEQLQQLNAGAASQQAAPAPTN